MSIIKEIGSSSSKRVYYQTSSHIAKMDEAGQEVFSKMKVDNVLEVWLMHPDVLPKFKQIVENSGKHPVEFDLAHYLTFPKPKMYANSFTDR
jgi:hypothetical protein